MKKLSSYLQIFRSHLYHQFFTDELFKFLSLDQFLCADEKHERAVGRSQHTVDLVDADAILHVKAPFLGLSAEQTSRPFQIVGSGAFAEAVSIEHDRDADL